jgi:LPS export ABC transporter protein LptC
MTRFIRLFLVLIASIIVSGGCSDQPPEESGYPPGKAPDEVFTDFVTQESDSGILLWSLTAPEAERYKDRQIVVMEHPKIVFYDEHGEQRTTLVAEAGEYYEDRRDMLAFGDVVVTSVDGDVLETDSLLWDNSANKIFSDSFVKLTRGRNVITGYGLECRDDLQSVEIKRDVKATVIDEQGEIEE